MSILVSGIRQPFSEPDSAAINTALKQCGLDAGSAEANIYRTSIDARRGRVYRVYTVAIDGVENEEKLVARLQLSSVRCKKESVFAPTLGGAALEHRPVVVGFGPAGLFCAYILASYGYNPLVLERGDAIEQRDHAVDKFWSHGTLETDSNIQFGEGGAGAYSDGKLTTRINDPLCDEVLRILVQFGAPNEIVRLAKPHIGTDILKNVVRSMREEIVKLGGEVRFRTTVTNLQTKCGVLSGVTSDGEDIGCEQAVIAVGHSARDTFASFHNAGVYMEPKPFSVGVRIEHLQTDINRALYGDLAEHGSLPPAEYVLSHREDGRACYSFCMCPGGQVVAAQSETETVVTNGMSYHVRDGVNANSALVVSVDSRDFDDTSPLGGIAFQRQIERAAFAATGSYRATCQKVGDFLEHQASSKCGCVSPSYPIGVEYGRVDACLPSFVTKQLEIGLRAFGHKMRGFDHVDALLTAPETRTSSPVRLSRGEDMYSRSVKGLIPCGEGAGYAGGIMSAAVDGMRAACCIMQKYAPLER